MTTPVVPPRALVPDVDPVRFEVIRNALLAITEEMGATPWRVIGAYGADRLAPGDGILINDPYLGGVLGNVIDGSAIIEEPDASTLVHPAWTAIVDEHANLVALPIASLTSLAVSPGQARTRIGRRS